MSLLLIPLALGVIVIGTMSLTVRHRRQVEAAVDVIPPRLSKRFDRKHRQLPRLMLEWAERRDKHGLGAWLRKLPPQQLNRLTSDVATYARDMGFDLLWIVDKQIDEVVLRRQIGDAVFQYLNAFYVAASAHDDMESYKQLTHYLNNLGSRRYWPQTRIVFKQLAADGIVDRTNDLLFQSKRQQKRYIMQSILQVSETDREAVKAAVRVAQAS